MPIRSSIRKPPHGTEVADRRAAADAPGGTLRRLKALLSRPRRIERHGHRLQLVLVERRRPAPERHALSLAALRADLRERLLAYRHDHAAHVMRHLAFVHDELGRSGWPGVAALPIRVISKALVQLDMLVSRQGSARLSLLAERLRTLHDAAERRGRRTVRPAMPDLAPNLEVSEATHEEFEEMQRSWVGTMPPQNR
jgi:hypothetical protein